MRARAGCGTRLAARTYELFTTFLRSALAGTRWVTACELAITSNLDDPCPRGRNKENPDAEPGRERREPMETGSGDCHDERQHAETRDQQPAKDPRAFERQVVSHDAAQ